MEFNPDKCEVLRIHRKTGIAENIPNRNILNFLIILMKNYIFKTKYRDKKPNCKDEQ